MNAILILPSICIIILLIWNLWSLKQYRRTSNLKEYYELNAKLNFITAMGSVFLLLGAYFGWNSIDKMENKIDEQVSQAVQKKEKYIDSSFSKSEHKINDSISESVKLMKESVDSRVNRIVNIEKQHMDSSFEHLIKNTDILKAGIYIVNGLIFKEDSMYKFEDIRTFDNKSLPMFSNPPKLILNTITGENLRIKKITNTYFVLGPPMSKYTFLATEADNPDYPKSIKFDIWIAEYKP